MANADDLYMAIKAACVTRIAALDLESDDESWGIRDHVHSQLAEDLSNVQFPCVIATSEGERVEQWGGTTLHFYYWYPVRVFITDVESMRQHNREQDYQAWAAAIRGAFQNKRLTDVDEVQRCTVEPGVNFQKVSQYHSLIHPMLFKFFVRLPRNTTF